MSGAVEFRSVDVKGGNTAWLVRIQAKKAVVFVSRAPTLVVPSGAPLPPLFTLTLLGFLEQRIQKGKGEKKKACDDITAKTLTRSFPEDVSVA